MKKRNLAVIAAWMMILLVTGCGGGFSEYEAETAAAEETMDTSAVYNASADFEDAGAAAAAAPSESYSEGAEEDAEVKEEAGAEPLSETGRKLIRNVRLELQTKEFDGLLENLSSKVGELGGYVESSSIYGVRYDSGNTRSADYTVRIPSDRLDEFINAVNSLGNVVYRSEEVQDVTLEYVDVESRKKALEAERDRLIELLEKAENMEDVLAIESKLMELRYELENYGSRLKVLDNQIDYSTVWLSINEVERITERKRGFFAETAELFKGNLYAVGRGLRGFAIGFLGSVPVLAAWAAAIAVLVLVLRKVQKRLKERRLRKLHAEEPGLKETDEKKTESQKL